ncbi:MAG: rubrerythrin family protein [Oscillospiraceae bacterium]|nr:rubrerythrin family protein [Oscillospiraceae bacterium]
MELNQSKTRQNLMRAFAGETQAWARYTFAAQSVRTQGFPVLERLFRYTGDQEKEHAGILWGLLKTAGTESVSAPGDYPVDLQGDALSLLRAAAAHEQAEAEEIYPAFAAEAEREGFGDIALRFRQLAAVEGVHGERFRRLAEAMEQGSLFCSDGPVPWICLNCGHVLTGTEPPAACPVCAHEQGFFVRLELSPFQ